MIRKSRSLQRLESKMEEVRQDSYRYRVLAACRQFKNSWIDLGQALVAVQRDKLYRDWDYLTFESYCSGELGIRRPTAFKLVKSYHFLQSEEPDFIKKAKSANGDHRKIPDLESIHLLRLAKASDKIEEKSYETIRKKVLDDAKDAQDIRRDLRFLVHPSENKDPRALRRERRENFFKRAIRSLETIAKEGGAARFLSADAVEDIEKVCERVRAESTP